MARTTLLLAAPALPHVLLLLLLLLLGTAADTPTTTSISSDQTTTQQQQKQEALSPPPPSSSSSPSSSSPPSSSSSSSSSTTTSSSSSSSPPSSSSSSSSSSTTSSSSSSSSSSPAKAKAKETPAAGFYKGMSREFVNEHNKVRSKYGAPTLAWDKKLAMYARRWASVIQQDCDQARHSPQAMPLGYGECFFVGNNGTAEDALCSWEREEFIYEKGTDHCTSGHDFRDCGHFIIMIEKSYHYVGCGRAPCLSGPRHGQFFISCNYSPVRPNATTTSTSSS